MPNVEASVIARLLVDDMVRRRFYSQIEERTFCQNLLLKCVKFFKFIK